MGRPLNLYFTCIKFDKKLWSRVSKGQKVVRLSNYRGRSWSVCVVSSFIEDIPVPARAAWAGESTSSCLSLSLSLSLSLPSSFPSFLLNNSTLPAIPPSSVSFTLAIVLMVHRSSSGNSGFPNPTYAHT